MNKTSIEWTDFTWNPIRARNLRSTDKRTGTFCTKISPGCKNCYASIINRRFGTGDEYEVPNLTHHEFFIDERILEEPLRRKKPARIFVGDMFDLCHEAIPVELIAEVLRVAWKCQWHTFQFLTKRAERMQRVITEMLDRWGEPHENARPNMWLGVSVESQKYADERIPLLLQTPAAVRFLSVEPLLEEVRLKWVWLSKGHPIGGGPMCNLNRPWEEPKETPAIDWVICGGESGPGARPFNLAWAESLLKQCRAAGVPFFMKQIGSKPQVHSCRNETCTHPDCGMEDFHPRNRKGGDPSEWPEHLRVREFPSQVVPA